MYIQYHTLGLLLGIKTDEILFMYWKLSLAEKLLWLFGLEESPYCSFQGGPVYCWIFLLLHVIIEVCTGGTALMLNR